MRLPFTSLMAAAMLAAAAPAVAQSSSADSSDRPSVQASKSAAFQVGPARRRLPAKKRPPVGVRVYGIVENEMLAATRSFSAVLGTSSLRHVGGGVDITRLWGGAFVRVDVTHASKTGSRVFVDQTLTVYSLHVPITVSTTPVEIGGGWRFPALD